MNSLTPDEEDFERHSNELFINVYTLMSRCFYFLIIYTITLNPFFYESPHPNPHLHVP